MANEFGVEVPDHTILSRLGRGGMASVYLAHEERLGRLVAVKVIDERFERDEAFRKRFEREARTAAGLTHANIVPVYQYGFTADARPYLSMAYLEGGSLRDRIRQRGALPVEEALAISRQVAAALLAAHTRHVVHRDLKPDNVLFQGDTAMLTDFGIAKVLDASTELTGTGMNPGTLKYFSPEQANEKAVDPRSDIYTLGVVLYEMLTGQLPIEGDSVVQLIMRIAHQTPAPLPERLRGLQPFLDMLLAKDPADRLGSCADVVAVIQAMERNWARFGDLDRLTDGVVFTPSGRHAPEHPPGATEEPTLPMGAAKSEPSQRSAPLADDPALARELSLTPAPVAAPPPAPAARPAWLNARTVVVGTLVAAALVGTAGYYAGENKDEDTAPAPPPSTAAAPAPAPAAAPAPAPAPAPVAAPVAQHANESAPPQPAPAAANQEVASATLTVSTMPANARVRVYHGDEVGPGERYHPGMRLEPGSVRLVVSKDGYGTVHRDVSLHHGDNEIGVQLTAVEPQVRVTSPAPSNPPAPAAPAVPKPALSWDGPPVDLSDMSARSVPSTTSVNVEFVNRTDAPVQLEWVDFQGASKVYATIAPSSAVQQQTYSGHLWRLRQNGEVVGKYRAGLRPQQRYAVRGSAATQ